jgi:hypothetical protein
MLWLELGVVRIILIQLFYFFCIQYGKKGKGELQQDKKTKWHG